MKTILILLLSTAMSGCSNPLWNIPGGKLQGPASVLDANLVPNEGGVMQLETNPADPYSVNIGFTPIDGEVYIDPAEKRGWYQNIKNDANVRIRFDGSDMIFTAVAMPVERAEILRQFEADRVVLRLAPRDSSN